MNEFIYNWINDDTIKPILEYIKKCVGLIKCNYIPDGYAVGYDRFYKMWITLSCCHR